MLYKMLTGSSPYPNDIDEQQTLRMQSGDVQLQCEYWNKYLKPPKVLVDLLEGMLNTDISERYSAERCIKSLDKWIAEMRAGIVKQCANKGIKDLPKNVKPLASNDLIKKALDNFKEFEAKSIPKVSIYNFFEREMLSNQERLVVTKVFKTLDQEGDGIFSIKEATDAYRKYCVKDGDNENK